MRNHLFFGFGFGFFFSDKQLTQLRVKKLNVLEFVTVAQQQQ